MAPVPTPPRQPDDAPESYVGLDPESAERRARARGWTHLRALPPGSIITMEFVVGRLNFEVDGGRVVRCWSG
ncbi:I78 family peptidase inhibitor [Streptomyces sp. NPDC093085]|uniref:I78 family peptidase inhibitor n=1 Tax=Streptomyces sp. NPDC093085 TaxID=3155068 RepID=UPI0034193954